MLVPSAVTTPSLPCALRSPPAGGAYNALVTPIGVRPCWAPADMATRQRYKIAPDGMGSTLSTATTSACTPVHCPAQGSQPIGRKLKAVAPLRIAGLAE